MAALRLALERGITNVRVGDIAAAAGVSPRTYNNYFSNRAQAICALGAQRSLGIASALRNRPAVEPLAEALVHAMVGVHGEKEPDKGIFRLIMCDQGLRGEFLRATATMHRSLTEAIAERIGMDADADLWPNLLAATYEGAMRAAMFHWLRPECTQALAEVLSEALGVLAPVASALEVAGERSSPGPYRRAKS
jgi:AcrR family transcriptional regulator